MIKHFGRTGNQTGSTDFKIDPPTADDPILFSTTGPVMVKVAADGAVSVTTDPAEIAAAEPKDDE